MDVLLTRSQFRNGVLERDGHKCVICFNTAEDVHHIIERRLWPDGGYYLDNGASLCGHCHIKAESTLISCEEIRNASMINRALLPPHLYRDATYDKWGNQILESGRRLKGELFCDESIQKILSSGNVLHLFDNRVKYPRTYHLPWSPGFTRDDKVLSLETIEEWEGRHVVVTLKMDGENTSMYSDGMHARSTQYTPHPSRDRARAIHAGLAHDIPQGWRICAENVTAVHSIEYENLPGHIMVFSIWNEHNWCLSWEETIEWAKLLGLPLVPTIWEGIFSEIDITESFEEYKDSHEGYVVRPNDGFAYADFRYKVGKWVRPDHVQTHGHWMQKAVKYNGMRTT